MDKATRLIASTAGLLAATGACAADTAAGVPDVGGSIVQMLLGLGLVIGLIFASLWIMKRLAGPRGAGAQTLRVIAGQAVGPRERVVIVEVGDTALVLGVAPGRVTTLHTLPKADLPAAPATTVALPPFAQRLKDMMEKRNAPRT